jgi:AcrR family transcriptional regulator
VNAPTPEEPPTGDGAAPHGSRERILSTAASLFYQQGIQATGVEELVEKAGVSKRTLYRLFGSKDGLVVAYLEQMSKDLVGNERVLQRTDLPPRERLLALFRRSEVPAAFRGCPFHNAAVELAVPAHAAHRVIHAHKQAFLERLTDTAREAGSRDPVELGHRLFVLFEGAMALATSVGSSVSFDYAGAQAAFLIDEAIDRRDESSRATHA